MVKRNSQVQFRIFFITVVFLLIYGNCCFAHQPTVLNHGDSIHSIEFSPVDSSLIASASDDPVIKHWNFQINTTTLLTGHVEKVDAVAFSMDGNLFASGGNDCVLMLWDIQKNLLKMETR